MFDRNARVLIHYNKPTIGHFTEFYFEPGQGPSLFLDIPHCVDFRTGQPTLSKQKTFVYQHGTEQQLITDNINNRAGSWSNMRNKADTRTQR